MTLPRHTPTPVSVDEQQRLLAIAGRAADAAARVTCRYFRAEMNIENKAGAGQFDPVTIADKEAELAIRAVLREHCPEIGFYGEEHEAIASGNGLVWVVDPIDGTRAFMSGMPLWGTLIGLYNGESAVLGLLDQPVLNERYLAVDNIAQLVTPDATRTLSTRQVGNLGDSVAYCTTPDMFTNPAAKTCFENVRDGVQLMRYGGDCYAYALLAAGHIDIVLDCDLQPYDIQALIPIVTAAGGIVTSWSGGRADDGGYVLACGSAALHSKILPLLQFNR